jgi:hypothetical protein
MEENGHVGVFTPTMTLEGKGKDERLVWVLSRHKNEEVWLGRSPWRARASAQHRNAVASAHAHCGEPCGEYVAARERRGAASH